MFDIDDIKRKHRYTGGHFFDADTMRFFDSRILETVYQGPGGVFFLTSERFHGSTYDGPRLYTVRKFNPESGDISTHSDYNRMTRTAATAAARNAAATAADAAA